MRVIGASFKICLFKLNVNSTTAPEFIGITDQIAEFVRKSEVDTGTALVFSKHTTTAITIQENEPLLITDLTNTLERIAPRNAYYRHNDFELRTVHMHEDECPNGHSHCQHLALGVSETVPVVDGQLELGEWQRLFLVELDSNSPSPYREVLVQIMGV